MEKINVTELRAHLPSFLAKAKAGKEIAVTSRGRVIARLVPPFSDKELTVASLKELRGSVLKYEKPTEPVGLEDWESLK